MTEVDAVMPESASLPSPVQMNAADDLVSSNIVNSNVQEQQLHESANGTSRKSNLTELQHLDIDEQTEEDDSQITTSSENGCTSTNGIVKAGVGDKVVKEDAKPLLSADNCTDSKGNNFSDAKSSDSTNESSSNEVYDSASDGSSTCDSKINESNDNVKILNTNTAPAGMKTECDSSVSLIESKLPPSAIHKDLGSLSCNVVRSDALPDNDVLSSSNANEAKSADCTLRQTDLAEATVESSSPVETGAGKNNSQGEISIHTQNKSQNSAGVVDLGEDDSDVEMQVPKKEPQHVESNNGEPLSNTTSRVDSTVKSNSISTDSDGAVVIGSDSENEAVAVPTPSLVPNLAITAPKAPDQSISSQIIDDDDDDCVVIEDDTPAPTSTDMNKRKNLSLESEVNSDDSQPPNKRQRNSTPTNNQITIKDARSLMPQDIVPKRLPDNAVYPVNITPAPNIMAGPPKLVPVGSAVPLPLTGLPPLGNTNANLLPGLTDDMFVLEAPSFIVPYIYEKPPSDNLKDIVKEIESQHSLTKEDLAEADKSDEFDMITEQNKDDKEEQSNKKKKRRRGGDDGDDSWSEESEDDDDDDDEDSDGGVRTKVLIKEATDDLTALKGAIKPAAAVAQSTANSLASKPGQENYFESPLGKFFMDIGVGLVQEFVQSDLIRLQKRKMRKSIAGNTSEFERAISALSGNLEASKKKNSAFKFTMKRCEFCNFKSESALAMANHYETPHMNGPLYKCNFCTFEIRNATEIVYHMEAVHNIKARLIKPLPYHQCPNCGFEDNGKAKLARHQPVCAKKFRPDLNMAPPSDWEAPAKIPRIKPRHGLVGTATAYQAMAAQAAAQKAALASIQQQQQQVAQARNLQAAAIAAQNAANKYRNRPPVVTRPGTNGGVMPRAMPTPVRNPMATNVVMPNSYQVPGPIIQAASSIPKKTLPGQPSISITPLPRQSAATQGPPLPSTSKIPPPSLKPGQNLAVGNKTQFVICEICDGYIKDLEQLRNHMQWMHKVKIHPKMIYNRPPLNCQKCQFRFFTDQGLERHLLGSHGLVTSSMQEAANKGRDAGRCPVCGRMYQYKLLNHVSRDHHMTLKPAHLSYKCTVCTATFGMYKQFETHVYTAHSTVAKKAMDGNKKNNALTATGPGSSNNPRGNLGVPNDSLLKPLKINDEITIIPQPASKPRITNMESHVID